MMRSLLRIGRRYRPAKQAPVIVDEDGVHIGADEVMPLLAEKFAKTERAVLSTADSLRGTARRCDTTSVDSKDIPDVMALACSFSKLKRGKAAGLTTLPSEMYSGAPLQAAVAHFPLMLRQLLRAESPLEWTGGQVAVVPKPGKPTTSVAGWRSILLLDPASKAVAKTSRPYLLSALDRIAFAAQCGGRKDMPLELPKSHVRLHLERLHSCRLSGSVLFLDGKHAYYAAVRSLLHARGDCDDCECLWRFAMELHPEPEVRRYLFRELLKPGILDEVSASTALCNYVRAATDKTWFSLNVSSGSFYATTTGTSPGAPLADLLYQLISTRFLSHVHAALAKLGHTTTTPCGFAAPIPGCADDYAVLLEAPSAALAVQQLREVVPHVFIGLGAIGVELNLARGKTEALLVLNGVGCRRLQQMLFSAPDPKLSFCLPSGAQKILCLSHHYIHLGGVVSRHAGYKLDVRAVSREADRVFSRLHKVLLRNGNLSIAQRVLLYQSLVLSKLQQGAMTWFFQTKGEMRVFQSAVDNWQRRMIGPLLYALREVRQPWRFRKRCACFLRNRFLMWPMCGGCPVLHLIVVSI